MDVKGKKLLVLGGVCLAKEIIKAAHRLGVYVVVTDYLSDSPAKVIADESFMVSATDVDSVCEMIKQEKIDGVLTGFVDMLLPYYANICKQAKLPCYGSYEQFLIATKKQRFKSLCQQYDIPTVKEYQLDYPFREHVLDKLEYPILIKPVDNSGARGIYICHDQEELYKYYPLSLSFSKSKQILVEKYMHAKEATIHYLIQDGKVIFCTMSDQDLSKKIDPNYHGYGFNLTFLAKPGKIKTIIGVTKVRKLVNVLDVVECYQIYDEIPISAVGTLKQVIIRTFGHAKTKDEMIILINKIQTLIRVYDDKGNDMLLPVFDASEIKEDLYE